MEAGFIGAMTNKTSFPKYVRASYVTGETFRSNSKLKIYCGFCDKIVNKNNLVSPTDDHVRLYHKTEIAYYAVMGLIGNNAHFTYTDGKENTIQAKFARGSLS
jgi:hypothetical protein